jgi:hypothetical protein
MLSRLRARCGLTAPGIISSGDRRVERGKGFEFSGTSEGSARRHLELRAVIWTQFLECFGLNGWL